MDTRETIYVKKTTIACDGDGGALGHPRVFLNVGKNIETVCPYCSKTYKLSDNAKTGADH